MKLITMISILLATTAGFCYAAETQLVIQTHTTVTVDSTTGDLKGGAHTQIKGIKVDPVVPTSDQTKPAVDQTSTTASTSPGSSITTAAVEPSIQGTTPDVPTPPTMPTVTATDPTADCPIKPCNKR